MMYLQAGPFRMMYGHGFLRYLMYGETELLRMIYFAFRDENWGTLEHIIENEAIEVGEDRFSIRYDCFHLKAGKKVFHWNASIRGNRSGALQFELDGVALEPVRRNRVGFCVLHPVAETVSEPVLVSGPGGTTITAAFPEYIAPYNPFTEVRSMRWRCMGHWYRLDFEGELFETEDQRNWTDASFKTFCTPLGLPFPVLLEKGERVCQRILFAPETQPARVKLPDYREVILSVTDACQKRLAVGTCLSPEMEADEVLAGRLRLLKLSHYRVDLDLSDDRWPAHLDKAAACLHLLSAPAEVVLQVSRNSRQELEDFSRYLEDRDFTVCSVTVLSRHAPVTEEEEISCLHLLQKRFPVLSTGIGTDYNFTEINRYLSHPFQAGFLSYAIHPQEHAFDDLSLVENLAAQADTVRTAKHRYGPDCRVHISPVTLKKRFNPYATDPARRVVPAEEQTDPRQPDPFCAVWTLGSIKYLTMGGAGSATYFQSSGDRGIIGKDKRPFPVYEALRMYQAIKAPRVRVSGSSAPLRADGLFFEDGNALIWNYTRDEQAVILPDGKRVKLLPRAFEAVKWGSFRKAGPG